MKTFNKTIDFKTKSVFDFIDVTEDVERIINESKIKDGLVNVQNLHTSAALIVNENEPLLLEDFKKNIERSAPQNIEYSHDNFDKRTVNMCLGECRNGHSHCKAIHLLVNTTLNIIDGKLQLGQWQRIFFVELDNSRNRKLQIQVIGN